MDPRQKPPPRPDPAWEESRLPGQRSGEGVKDIFKLLLRDIRRKAGLSPQEEPPPTEKE